MNEKIEEKKVLDKDKTGEKENDVEIIREIQIEELAIDGICGVY
jgi:mycofactocin precursor